MPALQARAISTRRNPAICLKLKFVYPPAIRHSGAGHKSFCHLGLSLNATFPSPEIGLSCGAERFSIVGELERLSQRKQNKGRLKRLPDPMAPLPASPGCPALRWQRANNRGESTNYVLASAGRRLVCEEGEMARNSAQCDGAPRSRAGSCTSLPPVTSGVSILLAAR